MSRRLGQSFAAFGLLGEREPGRDEHLADLPALRNVGEFAMFAFIPGGLGKLTLLPEKTGSGKIGTPWARMQAAALR